MEEDLILYMKLPRGVEVLRPLLHQFPFPVEIGNDELAQEVVLIQATVSSIAGLFYEGKDGDWQSYGVSMARFSSKSAEEVVGCINRVLMLAKVSHRVTQIIHELDCEDILASYESPHEQLLPDRRV
jgi:hypothetical protein